MRPLEILTPIVLAISLLWPITGRKRPPALGPLPAFALVVIAAHANIEGMRWQMYPLYAFAVITFLTSIPEFMKARQDHVQIMRPLRVLANLVLLAISTALPILLPVPSIRTP